MASSLSDEEFHRMQSLLLELKTANYELDGKSKRLEKELGDSALRVEMLDRELAKANKVISKSKKVKETEMLVQENDAFQRKLLSQEDEFRLQHQTLMAEISALTAANDELEKKYAVLAIQDGQNVGCDKQAGGKVEDKIRHLEAQNFALQKNLRALQEKYDKDALNLNEQQQNLETETGGEKSSHSHQIKEDAGQEGNKEENAMHSNDTDTLLKDVQLRLDTETEEKRLLKEELNTWRKRTDGLEEELKKLEAMMKRKQESYLQLQSEKELVYQESKKKYQELQEARERDQKYYQDRINKLQQEQEKAKQIQEKLTSSSEDEKQDLQRKVSELQKQVEAAGIVGNHRLQEQNQLLEQKMKELAALRQNSDDILAQLKESQNARQEAFVQVLEAQRERDSKAQSLQEVEKVAEKRKSLLDELAIKYQTEHDRHHEQSRTTEEQHQAKVKELKEEISTQKIRIQELSKSQSVAEELQLKVRSLDDSKKQTEKRLKYIEDELQQARAEVEDTRQSLLSLHQAELQALREEYSIDLSTLKDAQQQQVKEWEEKEVKLQREITDLNSTILSLNQHVRDGVNEKKIHEKKGMTVVKDLKKQLQAERKRAEKLQERLQEVLSQNGSKGMEELLQTTNPRDVMPGDSSSVSSLGMGTSGFGKDSVASGPAQSPMPQTVSASSPNFDPIEDYAELLRKLTVAQEQKWSLEEKVSYLETSNASLADDLAKKRTIIQHYVKTSSAGGRRQSQVGSSGDSSKPSVKKTKDSLKTGEQRDLHDMNCKLQLMLEETLTKNLHLQQNLEFMSQELQNMSKGAVIDSVSSSAVIDSVSNSAVIDSVSNSAVTDSVKSSAVTDSVSSSAVTDSVSSSAVTDSVSSSADADMKQSVQGEVTASTE